MEQLPDADELFGTEAEDSDDDVLVEEDAGRHSEAALVLDALGVQVRDARDVESRVVDSCDAKLQLPSKMAELTKVDRQIEGLLKRTNEQEDPNIPALKKALENREVLHSEVLELEDRVASATVSEPNQKSHKPWQRLKSSGSSLDLEEQSKLEQAIAAAYAAVERVGRSSSGLGRAASGEVTQRAVESKRKSESQSQPGQLARASLPRKGQIKLPLAEQALQRKVVDKSFWDADPVKEEKRMEVEPASSSLPLSAIDVNRLKPRAAQVHSVWKENNPAEWRAMQLQGELVPPQQNLLRKRPGAKRHQETAPAEAKKARRDDVNESVYQRRQELWNPGKSAAACLVPKQQLDEDGEPVCKPDPDRKKPRVRVMQEEIQVCEGLRCPKWLWQALYPYQHRCVHWLWGLHRDKMGGILADEMGLGKTVQIIAYLAVLHHSGVLQNMRVQNTSLGAASPPRTGGVLIVCPATLISQWRNEIHLWYPPLRVCVMHQLNEEDRKESIQQASSHQGVLITSYETMRIAIDALLEATWVLVILDEGQKIRNPHASITIACKRFSTAHRILLSGSPIQNNLQELWSLFDFVCPGRLGTLPVFTEEFAQPIESGNLMGATEVKIAAAYQCALALRELTEPCILRRTKAECMDVLNLPTKQEQVLFCHLTAEQYHLYVQFLETEQARRAKTATTDRKALGAVFFALSVLRKLCNHPDLLLNGYDGKAEQKEEPGEELWSFEKSGKMKVLAEIMKLWHRDGHRALIFVQTVQMLEVLELWMSRVGYTHSRIDGKTPVKRRLKLIEEFNEKNDLFAMLLTTRVGGVGLNIVGADRVLIFDPDWNPMTDVQARERAWRIGQKKEVSVYRLVLTGTVEEKIYHRQVYKHFLAQKVLQDPRQRRFFKWNDISDLFEVPAPPPNVTKMDLLALQKKYRAAFSKLDKLGETGEFEVETTEIMKAVSDLPMKDQHNTSKNTKDESNAILQTLYDAQGIKASFNHDKVEQTLLDRKLVGQSAGLVAQRALDALKRSARERSAHHISEPTWTGQRGRAGAQVKQEREDKFKVSKVPGSSRTASADILHGLRQLAAIRGMAQGDSGREPPPSGTAPEVPKVAEESNCAGLPLELFDSDRSIAEDILKVFQDKSVAGSGHSLTTGQVLEKLAVNIASHHNDLFKSLLKQMCVLTKSQTKNSPGYWTLRKEFWPRR
ncbi:CSB [Symbiodinium microadriaticum]|nr:CSB [Symbiodinium microadriaticum]CAE7945832.1 CSB [Symbiodinium sp. KB8]